MIHKRKNWQTGLRQNKKMKRSIIDWEKMFLNHISDKFFMSRMYKELPKLNIKK